MDNIQCTIDGSEKIVGNAVNTIGSLILNFSEPRRIIKMANALNEVVPIYSQIYKENPGVYFEVKIGDTVIKPREFKEILTHDKDDPVLTLTHVIKPLIIEAIEKLENLEAIVTKAYVDYSDKENFFDSEINKDWFVRFCEIASKISDEDTQFLWAKILEGELEKPNSCSLRTLDVLKNLSTEEANIFNKLAKYTFENGNEAFILNYDELFPMYGISFSDILKVVDAGLVQPSNTLQVTIESSDNDNCRIFYGKYVIIFHAIGMKETKIALDSMLLTRAGRELLKIVMPIRSSEDVKKIASFLQNNDKINMVFAQERKT